MLRQLFEGFRRPDFGVVPHRLEESAVVPGARMWMRSQIPPQQQNTSKGIVAIQKTFYNYTELRPLAKKLQF